MYGISSHHRTGTDGHHSSSNRKRNISFSLSHTHTHSLSLDITNVFFSSTTKASLYILHNLGRGFHDDPIDFISTERDLMNQPITVDDATPRVFPGADLCQIRCRVFLTPAWQPTTDLPSFSFSIAHNLNLCGKVALLINHLQIGCAISPLQICASLRHHPPNIQWGFGFEYHTSFVKQSINQIGPPHMQGSVGPQFLNIIYPSTRKLVDVSPIQFGSNRMI